MSSVSSLVRDWSVGGLMLLALTSTMPANAARLTVAASRPELLYSQTESPDCTALFNVDDAALPLYAVRLRVTPPAGVPLEEIRFQWELPVPNVGVLAADEDLGPDAQASVVRTLCSDVGNQCILTAEQLAVYNKPTILWIAPTCQSVPDATARPFAGDLVKIGVRAFRGKRRAGKGSVAIGYGRLARVTLVVADPGRPFRDGSGKPGGEPIFINPVLGARLDTRGQTLPAITNYSFDSGGGDSASTPAGCAVDPSLAACTGPEDILYTAGGKHIATLGVNFEDGSALCDKLACNVRTTEITFAVDVTTAPQAATFTPGQDVGLRVRVRNTSPPDSGGNILIRGQAATCETEVKLGKSTLKKTTRIDLQHCSSTVSQGCTNDADCTAPECPDCEPSETCLTADHCTTPVRPVLGCASDQDCQPPRCSICLPSDTCVKVLPVPSIFLGVGDSVDLVDSTVTVDNALPSPAKVKDTWTAHTFNAGSETDDLTYTIGPKR